MAHCLFKDLKYIYGIPEGSPDLHGCSFFKREPQQNMRQVSSQQQCLQKNTTLPVTEPINLPYVSPHRDTGGFSISSEILRTKQRQNL